MFMMHLLHYLIFGILIPDLNKYFIISRLQKEMSNRKISLSIFIMFTQSQYIKPVLLKALPYVSLPILF